MDREKFLECVRGQMVVRALVQNLPTRDISYPDGRTMTDIIIHCADGDGDGNRFLITVAYRCLEPMQTSPEELALLETRVDCDGESAWREGVNTIFRKWEMIAPLFSDIWLIPRAAVACAGLSNGSRCEISPRDFHLMMHYSRLHEKVRTATRNDPNGAHLWAVFYRLDVFIREQQRAWQQIGVLPNWRNH